MLLSDVSVVAGKKPCLAVDGVGAEGVVGVLVLSVVCRLLLYSSIVSFRRFVAAAGGDGRAVLVFCAAMSSADTDVLLLPFTVVEGISIDKGAGSASFISGGGFGGEDDVDN